MWQIRRAFKNITTMFWTQDCFLEFLFRRMKKRKDRQTDSQRTGRVHMQNMFTFRQFQASRSKLYLFLKKWRCFYCHGKPTLHFKGLKSFRPSPTNLICLPFFTCVCVGVCACVWKWISTTRNAFDLQIKSVPLVCGVYFCRPLLNRVGHSFYRTRKIRTHGESHLISLCTLRAHDMHSDEQTHTQMLTSLKLQKEIRFRNFWAFLNDSLTCF